MDENKDWRLWLPGHSNPFNAVTGLQEASETRMQVRIKKAAAPEERQLSSLSKIQIDQDTASGFALGLRFLAPVFFASVLAFG